MNIFRLISFFEGISYLLILCVSFGLISRAYVFPLGAAHGGLFVCYLVLSLYISHKQEWSLVTWLVIFLASLVPFAFIPVELFLRKEMIKYDSNNTRI